MRRRVPIDSAIEHYYDTLYSEENEKRLKPDRFMEELVRGTVREAAEIDKEIEAKVAALAAGAHAGSGPQHSAPGDSELNTKLLEAANRN